MVSIGMARNLGSIIYLKSWGPDAVAQSESVNHWLPMQKVGSLNPNRVNPMTDKIDAVAA